MVNTLLNKVLGENEKCVFYFYLKTEELLGQPNNFVSSTKLCPLLWISFLCSWCMSCPSREGERKVGEGRGAGGAVTSQRTLEPPSRLKASPCGPQHTACSEGSLQNHGASLRKDSRKAMKMIFSPLYSRQHIIHAVAGAKG